MRVSTLKIMSIIIMTIGIITGIVLSVLQAVRTINIGWFWATFPFWAPIALQITVFFLAFIGLVIEYKIHERN